MTNSLYVRAVRSLQIAILLAFVAVPVRAQQIDRQQTLGQAGGWSVNPWGTSFKPTASTVAGAGVLFQAYGDVTVSLTAELWSGGLPNGGGTLIDWASQSFSVTGGDIRFLDVFFNTAATVTPSAEYYLAFISDDDTYRSAILYARSGDEYADGVLIHSGSTDRLTASYYALPEYDLAFREFSEGPGAQGEPEATPEPAALVLMATGFVGLGAFARRRRAVP